MKIGTRARGFCRTHARVPIFIIFLLQNVQYAISRKTHSGEPGRGGPYLVRPRSSAARACVGDPWRSVMMFLQVPRPISAYIGTANQPMGQLWICGTVPYIAYPRARDQREKPR